MKYAVLGIALLVGCVNARDEFDQFGDRIPDAAPPIDSMIVSTLPDVTGQFYTAARPPLGEDRYFHFHTVMTFTPVTENTGLLDYSAQPLDYQTFEPVGEPFVIEDAEVRNDATADIPLVGPLPARANSVTGTEVQLDAIIHAELRTADFVCGTLTGVGGGLSLDGSTFGAVRIPDGGALPPLVARCADQPQ